MGEAVNVERLAQAAYHSFLGRDSYWGPGHPWSKCGASQRDAFLVEVRAVLAEIEAQGFVLTPRVLATLTESELAAEARRRHEAVQDVIAEQARRKQG